MSWFLFKETPSVQQRGKKVDGFIYQPRNHINISWGMNELQSRPSSQYTSTPSHNPITNEIVPTTLHPPEQQAVNSNMKVLTETSQDEQQQLMKLIKSHQDKKIQQEIVQRFQKSKNRGSSVKSIIQSREDRSQSRVEFDKRIRYLENSLLPSSRRNSIATVLDHGLNQEVPLEQSRMSGKSALHNKKNQTTLTMNDGYNHFSPPQKPKLQHLDKLRDQYRYEETISKRMQRSNIHFG